MKRFEKLQKLGCVLVCTLLIIACEKSDGESEFIDAQEKEGFMSETGKHDSEIEELQSDEVTLVLHMSFDGDLSEEEASAKFDVAVKNHFKNNSIQSKDVSTEWGYRIATHTGPQSNNNTDGEVQAKAYFKTNQGTYVYNRILDNVGNDREKNQWDYYYFTVSPNNAVISWIELTKASIRLKGTDGWFIKRFYVQVYPGIQTISATGYTYIISSPNTWLDNNTASGWDTYATGNIGNGRLNF